MGKLLAKDKYRKAIIIDKFYIFMYCMTIIKQDKCMRTAITSAYCVTTHTLSRETTMVQGKRNVLVILPHRYYHYMFQVHNKKKQPVQVVQG